MKIFKYIFFFIVLSAISLTVFIATQDSTFTISKSKEIDLPKRTVFNYLSELKNVEQWQVFNESKLNFAIDSLSKGKNAKISWNNNSLQTIELFPTDSLTQVLNLNGETSNLKWILKSNGKNTLVSLVVDGKMDFLTKFKSFFLGGIEKIEGPIYDKTLNSLNHNITEQYKTFEIKNEGIVLVKEQFYIKQIVSGTLENLGEQIFESMNNMKRFCNENDLKMSGDPFTIFEKIDFKSGKIDFAVCVPITTEIFTNQESDITGGKFESFYAYKTTLKGDYSHSDKAWKENNTKIVEHKLTKNTNFKPVSVYKTNILDTSKASEWITEFLTPVNESVIYVPETTNDSLQITQ